MVGLGDAWARFSPVSGPALGPTATVAPAAHDSESRLAARTTGAQGDRLISIMSSKAAALD
jgi:hypothetical protein